MPEITEVNENLNDDNNVDDIAMNYAETNEDQEFYDEPVQKETEDAPSLEKDNKLQTIEEVTEDDVTERITEEVLSVEKDNKLEIAEGTKEEGSEKNSENIEEPVVATDNETEASEVSEDVPESQDFEMNVDFQVNEDGDLQAAVSHVTFSAPDIIEIPAKDGEEIEKKEKDTGEETNMLSEAQKLISDIDQSKIITEADTQLEYHREVVIDPLHITIQEELPEIRGLAELEYESSDSSLKQESSEILQSKRKQRPSIAVRLLMEEEAEAERRKKAKKESRKEKEAEEEEEAEDESTPLTTEEYFALYDKIVAEIPYIKMKNKFLQRKIADSFKRRKMEHALKEEQELQREVVKSYEKKLDRLSNLFVVHKTKTTKSNKELDDLRKEKDDKYTERNNIFHKLINRERETGLGLINTKTGKQIPDKVVEHLLRREISASKQIADLRLKFIAKRNEIAEITAELKALDNIGDDLSLMDYEQLKIENRALSDKLEEKEEELTKLRVKCRNTVQIMAHVREKCAALDADMDAFKEDYEEVRCEYIEIRERLNSYKTERDIIRNKTMKLKADSGLLTKPKLLQDMETSMQEVKLYEETLEKVKREYREKTQKIRNLRKNIANEMIMSRKHPKEKKKKKPSARFYKVRPTLITPELPKGFLDKFK